MRLLIRSLVDFVKNGGFGVASSLSFYFILTLAPFLLFLSVGLNLILINYSTIYTVVSQKVLILFPPMFKAVLSGILQPLVFKKISIFNSILYALASLSYFYTLDVSLNKIFKVSKRRSFFSVVFVYLLLIVLMMIFVFVYLAGFFLPIKAFSVFLNNLLKINIILDFFGVYIMPFLALFIVSFMLYKILPRKKVSLKNATLGAIFFALMLEILKRLFVAYVVKIAKLSIVYGAFWGFIAFLVWVYVFFCTFLIGAYIVKNLEETL